MSTSKGDTTILSATTPDARVANAKVLCQIIEASLDDDKAEDIVSIDLSGKSSFADFMIVASGRSQRHVGALANKLQQKLKDAGHPPLSIEGMESSEWVLIDAGDVVIHLFRPEVREYYNIEKMWAIPTPVLVEPRHDVMA